MISWKASTALFRMASVSSMPRDASVAAIVYCAGSCKVPSATWTARLSAFDWDACTLSRPLLSMLPKSAFGPGVASVPGRASRPWTASTPPTPESPLIALIGEVIYSLPQVDRGGVRVLGTVDDREVRLVGALGHHHLGHLATEVDVRPAYVALAVGQRVLRVVGEDALCAAEGDPADLRAVAVRRLL